MELTATDVDRWLAEDIGEGDLTTLAVVDEDAACRGTVLLKQPGVVCGLAVAADVFERLDVSFEPRYADGDRVSDGPIADVAGPARGVLGAERVALNLIGRLSGIATQAARYVEAVAGTGAVILDTRKTTPGLRALEKHAVACGGAQNHRLGLFDGILIKDNHLRLFDSLRDAVLRAKDSGNAVEVECDTIAQVREALDAGADSLLLDNMSTAELREAVALAGGRVRLEASGGVTLETVREIAETGVDFISVGALTHSARALDVSLEVE